MPATCILRCGDDSFYVGSTRDLARRMEQHHSDMGGDYTRKRQPVELVWFHEFERVEDAYALEKRVQGWSRAKRQALIDGRFEALPGLSSRARERSSWGFRDASGGAGRSSTRD
jgi:putative endonuclease